MNDIDNNQINEIVRAIFHSRNEYILLLGAGISRAAGIPQAEEIIDDLIKEDTYLYQDTSLNSSEKRNDWYKNKYHEPPTYSNVIQRYASGQAQTHNRLKGYFEPSEQDKKKGKKSPTATHICIAELVKDGFIKYIITTNFDKLLENALLEKNVQPITIINDDDLNGTPNFENAKCVIFKVNGDFLDIRFKNKSNELDKYDERITSWLKFFFETYGLMICGWSAKSDNELARLIKEHYKHSYTAYWTYINALSQEAEEIIEKISAKKIKISNADDSFNSIKIGIDNLKNHILEKKEQFSLNNSSNVEELLDDQSIIKWDKYVDGLFKEFLSMDLQYDEKEKNVSTAIINRMSLYDQMTQRIRKPLISIIRYAREDQLNSFKNQFLKKIQSGEPRISDDLLFYFQNYPAFSLMYLMGISAVLYDRYDALYKIIMEPRVKIRGTEAPLALLLGWSMILIDQTHLWNRDDLKKVFLPISHHLYNLLWPYFKENCTAKEYEMVFDKFEYLANLIHSYEYQKIFEWSHFLSGLYFMRYSREIEDNDPNCFIWQMEHDADEKKEEWPLLKAGFFDKSFEKFKEFKSDFDRWLKKEVIPASFMLRENHYKLPKKINE